ncbi:hypothetical protein C8J56DRAFT_943694 [Mycena floridula]|nr:hypothetical protein C8J56DRAFT_943694 [Mycena floridula]
MACKLSDGKAPGGKTNLSPNILAKMRQNVSLSLSETDGIRSMVAGLRNELDRCKAETLRLERLLQDSRDREAQLDHSIQNLLSPFAPVRRLPVEILALIFTESLRFRDTVDSCTVKNGLITVDFQPYLHGGISRHSFKLATVCRFWRAVMLSISSLWSTILLSLDDTEESTVEILRVMLERSSDHHLSLFLVQNHDVGSDAIMVELAVNDARIAHMQIYASVDPFVGFEPNFQNLVALDLTLVKGESASHKLTLPWIASAPKLALLEMVNNGRLSTHFWHMLPTENMTTFHNTGGKFSNTLLFLSRCPNTTIACLGFDANLNSSRRREAVEMNRLQELTVTVHSEARDLGEAQKCSLEGFFQNLTLPALHKLVIMSENSYDKPVPGCHAALSDFICKSQTGSKLTHLTLEGVGITCDELLEILCLLPLISFLSLADNYQYSTIVTQKTLLSLVPTSVQPIIPVLTKLRLAFADYFSNQTFIGALARLIDARNIHQSIVEPLQEVHLTLIPTDNIQVAADKLWEDGKRGGVRVHVEIEEDDESDDADLDSSEDD